MKKLFMLLLLLPLIAVATDKQKPPYNPPPDITVDNSIKTMQKQQQQQQQQQQQTQANEQSISFSAPKQAASAIAPGVYGANPCYYGKSGALGFDRVNLGGGKQVEDPNCAKLETSRMLGALGEVALAIEVACATESAIEVLGDRCKPSLDLKNRIEQLEKEKAVLLAERVIDRQECNDSKQRITEACQK